MYLGKQPIPVTKPGEGYAEFLRGWNEYKDDPSVYFVHFENLKTVSGSHIMPKFICLMSLCFPCAQRNYATSQMIFVFLTSVRY